MEKNLIDYPEIVALFEKITEEDINIIHFKEQRQAVTKLEELNVDEKIHLACLSLESLSELQGFVNGFKTAVNMLKCFL